MAPAVAPKLPDPSMQAALIRQVQEHVAAILVPVPAAAVPVRVAAALPSIETAATEAAVVVLLVELPVAGCQQCSEPTSEQLLDQWCVGVQP